MVKVLESGSTSSYGGTVHFCAWRWEDGRAIDSLRCGWRPLNANPALKKALHESGLGNDRDTTIRLVWHVWVNGLGRA